jgi:hypothetical protein
MEDKDSRYYLIKPMITEGRIVSFNDIFKFIPKTIVARDIGKKVDRFTELMHKVEKFTYEETFLIARLCEIDRSQIIKLVQEEYAKNKNNIFKI